MTEVIAKIQHPPAINQIMALIRARVPIIYVTTHEETRFIENFKDSLEESMVGRNLWTWSQCQGLVKGFARGKMVKCSGAEDKTDNPRMALEAIVKHDVPEGKQGDIYIMRDMHKVMTQDIPRMLRDMYDHLINKRKIMIIIAPYVGYGALGATRGIEPSLEKQITVVNFDLPSRDMLVDTIRKAVEGLKKIKNASKAKLDYTDEEFVEFARACQGLTIEETRNTVATCVVQLLRIDVHRLLQEKKHIIRKSDILEYIESDVKTSDVGGMDEAKKFFDNYKDSFTDEARAYGVEPLRGVLLTGVPGTGKSLLAKGIADSFKIPLLRLDVGKVMAGLVGASEQRMREAIATAEAVAPCILWLDEVEKAMSGTGSSNFSDGGTLARVFGTLLTAMQEGMNDILVVATANDISKLPPEFIRRFSEMFFVDLPADEERAEIFTIHLTKRKRDVKNFDLKMMVKKSVDFTGAEIEKAVKDSLALAWSDGKREVETKDVLVALSATRPIAKVMAEPIEKLRDWARNRARYASSAAAKKNGVGAQTVGKGLSIAESLEDIGEIKTPKEDMKKAVEDSAKDNSSFDLDLDA